MNAILLWMLQCFIMTAVMVPIVILLVRFFRYRPAIQHALWVVVLLKFVTPSIVAWPWQLPEIGSSATSRMPEQMEKPSPTNLQPITIFTENAANALNLSDGHNQTEVSHAYLNSLSNVSLPRWALGLLFCVWLAGSLVFVIRQYRQVRQQALVIRRGTAAPPLLSDIAAEVALQSGLQPIPLLIVSGISSPFIWCLGRSKLVWPEQMLHDETSVSSRSVIAHEFAHLRRRDHWVAWLELVAATIWWWNPLFWFVRRHLRTSAESACDALALEAYPEDRCVYAELLLELSTVPKNGASALVLNVSASTPRHFERRMSMIVSETVSGRLSVLGFVLAGLLALMSVPTWSFGEANERRQIATVSTDGAKQADVPQPAAENRAAGIPNFAVFPVKTALQRRMMGWPVEDRANARAYVIINGMAVCNDAGVIDEKALDMQALRTALAPYADDKTGVVFMNVHYNSYHSSPARNHNAEKLVVWGLEGLGKDIGFKSARGITTWHYDRSFDWAKEFAMIQNSAGEVDQDEDPVGDDSVQVYAVRTLFSNLLTHADCIVDIEALPNESGDTVLPQNVRQSITKYVGEAKPREKRTISFAIRMSKLDEQRRARLCFTDGELDVLAKSLGFSGSSVSTR